MLVPQGAVWDHVARLCARLGLEKATEQIERELGLSFYEQPPTADDLATVTAEALATEWAAVHPLALSLDLEAKALAALQGATRQVLGRQVLVEQSLVGVLPPASAEALRAVLPEPFASALPAIEHRPAALHQNVAVWAAVGLWAVATYAIWKQTEVELGPRILMWVIASAFLWFCTTIVAGEPAWPKHLKTVGELAAHLADGVREQHTRLAHWIGALPS